jgi:hypothetical protein
MFGDGIASCTLKEHISYVYIYLGHIWPTKIAMLEKAPCMCTTILHQHLLQLHYLTKQNIIEPHGVSYHFSVFGGHRRPRYLDLFERGLLVAILSPKNVRFQLGDPDLV